MTIDEMQLTPLLAAIARDFVATFPSVQFISGLRTIESQAQAMAADIMQSKTFIRDTYIASPIIVLMTDAVDALTTPLTQDAVEQCLWQVMQGAAPEDLLHVSKHLPGEDSLSHAFDCLPASVSDNARIWLQSRVVRSGGRVLFTESGLDRVHVQI
jgi:hypothetical protein